MAMSEEKKIIDPSASVATATTTVTTEESTTLKSDDLASFKASESSVIGVTVRAWLTTIIVGSVCYMSIMGKEVFEPLYGMALLSIGFYFGTVQSKK